MARHQALQKRYIDISKPVKISNKTGDEIAAEFLNKWNGGIN